MRKYRFTSREAAEQAEAQAARDRDNLSVALNAALEGRIAWLPAIPGETANSPYYCLRAIAGKEGVPGLPRPLPTDGKGRRESQRVGAIPHSRTHARASGWDTKCEFSSHTDIDRRSVSAYSMGLTWEGKR